MMQRRAFLAGAGGLTAVGGAALLSGCAGHSASELREKWPPIGRFVEVDGIRVHYWEQGTGQPVILIHGASGNLRDWTFDVAPRLAERYRVIAFDRPGFGYSERVPERGWDPEVQAAVLHAAAAEIDAASDAIVVGHSWGGALAMAWGLAFPDEVAGLVSVAGATMPFEGGISLFNRLAASEIGPIVAHAVEAVATESLLEGFVEEVFSPQPIPQGYMDYIGAPLSARARTIQYNARDITHLSDQLAEQARLYPELQVPVEILHGTADTTVGLSIHSRPMADLLPNARLTVLDGLGHMPHHFAYDALAAAIGRLAPSQA